MKHVGWAWDDVEGHLAAFIICRTPSHRLGSEEANVKGE